MLELQNTIQTFLLHVEDNSRYTNNMLGKASTTSGLIVKYQCLSTRCRILLSKPKITGL